jgi:hypothetical protein
MMTETKKLFVTLSTDINLNREKRVLPSDEIETFTKVNESQNKKLEDNEWLVEYESIYRSYHYDK